VRVRGVGAVTEVKDETRLRRARSDVGDRIATEAAAVVAVDEVVGVVERTRCRRRGCSVAPCVCSSNQSLGKFNENYQLIV